MYASTKKKALTLDNDAPLPDCLMIMGTCVHQIPRSLIVSANDLQGPDKDKED